MRWLREQGKAQEKEVKRVAVSGKEAVFLGGIGKGYGRLFYKGRALDRVRLNGRGGAVGRSYPYISLGHQDRLNLDSIIFQGFAALSNTPKLKDSIDFAFTLRIRHA